MVRKTFFDADVLISAYSTDIGEASRRCLKQAWIDRNGVVSTTVLRDFYRGLRTNPSLVLSAAQARQCVEDYLSWHVVVDDVMTLTDAMKMDEQAGIAADAGLVLQAALASNSDTLFSYRVPLEIGDVPIRVLRPEDNGSKGE